MRFSNLLLVASVMAVFMASDLWAQTPSVSWISANELGHAVTVGFDRTFDSHNHAIGDFTVVNPIVGIHFAFVDTDKNVDFFNSPTECFQLLNNAYWCDLKGGLESTTQLTDQITGFVTATGGVKFLYGNLMKNPLGFVPTQQQIPTPAPTEYDAAGFFELESGLRATCHHGGQIGAGFVWQSVNTKFPTGVRNVNDWVGIRVTVDSDALSFLR